MDKFFNKFRVTLSHIFFITILSICFLSLIFESIAYRDFYFGSFVYLCLYAALYVAFIFHCKNGNRVLLVTFMAVFAALNLLNPFIGLQGFGDVAVQFDGNVALGLAYILNALIAIALFAVLVLYFIKKLANLNIMDNIIKLVLLICMGVCVLYFILLFIGLLIMMIDAGNGLFWYQMLLPIQICACLGVLIVNYDVLENKASE